MFDRIALERDGFLVVPHLLDPEQVDQLTAAIVAASGGPGAIEREGRTYASRNLLREAPAVRRLAGSAAVRALVTPVLGADAFVVRGLFFDKTPEANWTVPWHQDLAIAVQQRADAPGFRNWTIKAGVPHVQAPAELLARMLTVRIHLDDCGPDDGPLRVVPGSHRDGRLGVEDTRRWLDRVGPTVCVVPSGGALLMRPLLLHASSPAAKPTHRRVIHLEFAAERLPSGLAWYEDPAPREAELV